MLNYLNITKLRRLHWWSLAVDKLFHPTLNNWSNFSFMLGFKLNLVNKRTPVLCDRANIWRINRRCAGLLYMQDSNLVITVQGYINSIKGKQWLQSGMSRCQEYLHHWLHRILTTKRYVFGETATYVYWKEYPCHGNWLVILKPVIS